MSGSNGTLIKDHHRTSDDLRTGFKPSSPKI